MQILHRAEIEAAVNAPDAIAAVEEAFRAYSAGQVEVPPVGHLAFKEPPGDVHIKYGHRRGDPSFVVKIASGFYDNPQRGLSSSAGLMLVFSAETGFPQALLMDEGWLTDLRTAAAGAVAARYLAPKNISAIGIIGAGIQARMQLDLLRHVTPCREAVVWARNPQRAAAFAVDGFRIRLVSSTAELCRHCNLIVTTTPATEPLVRAPDVQPGTHITAMGADGPGKQELDPELFASAHVCAVDARKQCLAYGDSSHAVRAELVRADKFVELGEIIANRSLGRTSDDQITIADLTGVAAQDVAIATLAWARLRDRRGVKF
jgi:ornithine cyclodeaminase